MPPASGRDDALVSMDVMHHARVKRRDAKGGVGVGGCTASRVLMMRPPHTGLGTYLPNDKALQRVLAMLFLHECLLRAFLQEHGLAPSKTPAECGCQVRFFACSCAVSGCCCAASGFHGRW